MLSVVSAAATGVVTLDEAKLYAKVDLDDDDALIGGLITAATEMVEMTSRRALITQTLRLTLDAVPLADVPVTLLRPPVQSIDAVRVYDTANDAHVVDNDGYWVDVANGRFVRSADVDWPDVTPRKIAACEIDYVAGYGDAASDVPERYRTAVLALVLHWYDQRTPVAVAQGLTALELPLHVRAFLMIDRGGWL